MIDPLSAAALTTVLTGVVNGATEEVGASTLHRLGRLLRRSGNDREAELVQHSPAEADPAALARLLAQAAADDASLREAIGTWADEVGKISVDSSTTNTVHGDVQGRVVQGRDFHGPLYLG